MKKQNNSQSYYIGCRNNPQLSRPYFKAYGQLSKSSAREKEKCIYGTMTLVEFKTHEEYKAEIERLKLKNFVVY